MEEILVRSNEHPVAGRGILAGGEGIEPPEAFDLGVRLDDSEA